MPKGGRDIDARAYIVEKLNRTRRKRQKAEVARTCFDDLKLEHREMQLTRLFFGATRGVMTSKRGNKYFYKGRGVRNPGFHTKKGQYIVVKKKVPEFIVPDLTGFQLKPYVSWKAPKVDIQPMTAEKLIEDLKRNIHKIEHFEVP